MSQMIEVKTAELIGPALNYATAIADGWNMSRELDRIAVKDYAPSEDWAQGGPLIEKYRVWITDQSAGYEAPAQDWCADVNGPQHMNKGQNYYLGESPLTAACRAIVAAKLGDVVSVPVELVEGGK